jgi:hypothetical protein
MLPSLEVKNPVNELTAFKAKCLLEKVYDLLFLDGKFYNGDKEVSGSDFVQACTELFEAEALVPPSCQPGDQWVTYCPNCHGQGTLRVVEATLTATGEKVCPNTELTGAGFIVDPDDLHDDLKDQSTEDEVVQCDICHRKFDLSDLAREAT